MIVSIIRWVKGNVTFVAKGKFPERFINLMNINGIRYWNSSPCNGGFQGTMQIFDYLSIRKLAKKSNVRLKIVKKSGLPFLVNKYKKRKGIAVGFAISVILLIFLSQFVWSVNIEGCKNLSEQEIKPILKECGLYVGAYKKGIDAGFVERNTLLKIKDVKWITVNMLNNVAKVEIKEKAKKPKINKKYPCNIKATCDGVITKATVLNGTGQVKVGSGVVKNQVLINSVMTNGAEKIKYVHSQGEILADVKYSKIFSVDNEKNYEVLSENTNKINGNFLWFEFPLVFSSSINEMKIPIFTSYKLKVNNIELPIGYRKEKTYYIKEISKKENKKSLKNKLALYELFNESNSVIKKRKISYIKNDNGMKLKVSYIVNKSIGKKQKIDVKP